MQPNESNRGYDPARQERIERQTDDDSPDHDVPVEEQLTEAQRELVGRDGGGDDARQ
jgi:hypothetical protein